MATVERVPETAAEEEEAVEAPEVATTPTAKPAAGGLIHRIAQTLGLSRSEEEPAHVEQEEYEEATSGAWVF